MNSAIVRKCDIFDGIRGVIVYLIEVFLIAMIYILYVVSLVASPPGHLATHLILALIINRRCYLDARTAFTLLCNMYWHQDGDIKFCDV
jgi:hypothetical protein